MTQPGKTPSQAGFEPRIFRSRGGRLTTTPTRRSALLAALPPAAVPPLWLVVLVSPAAAGGETVLAGDARSLVAAMAMGGSWPWVRAVCRVDPFLLLSIGLLACWARS